MTFGRGTQVIAAAITLFAGNALAQDQAPVEKLVQMNEKALDHYRALEWDSARSTLIDAVVAGREARLVNHPVMAQTLMNLGAVYLTGFDDREKANEGFARALAIDPTIQLTPGIATPAMKKVFAKASRARRIGEQLPPKKGQTVLTLEDDLADRDLPVKLRDSALDCPNEEEAIVDRPAMLRCAVAPNLTRVVAVFLMYRDPKTKRFTELQTARSRKGWYLGRIPKKAVSGKALFYYFEGRDASGKPVVTNSSESSPNILLLVDEDTYNSPKVVQSCWFCEE